MLSQLIIVAIVTVPAALILLFRSHAGVVFLALCAGVVLQKYSQADAEFIVSAALPNSGPLIRQAVNMALVGLPALAVLILQRKKAKGLKLAVGIIPALLTGVLLLLSVMPYISPLSRLQLINTPLWSFIHQFEGLFVLLGILTSLVLLIPSRAKDEKHKKHAK